MYIAINKCTQYCRNSWSMQRRESNVDRPHPSLRELIVCISAGSTGLQSSRSSSSSSGGRRSSSSSSRLITNMGRSPCCEKAHTNKGAWTKEEDQKLVDYIKAHGEGCWRTVPQAAGLSRCGKSCRLRWINYLRPDLKRGNFSEEEDELIIKLHALLGNKWSLIAGRLSGRTDNEIKNHWNSHIKRKLLSRGIDPKTHQPTAAAAQEHVVMYIPMPPDMNADAAAAAADAAAAAARSSTDDGPTSRDTSGGEENIVKNLDLNLDLTMMSSLPLEHSSSA